MKSNDQGQFVLFPATFHLLARGIFRLCVDNLEGPGVVDALSSFINLDPLRCFDRQMLTLIDTHMYFYTTHRARHSLSPSLPFSHHTTPPFKEDHPLPSTRRALFITLLHLHQATLNNNNNHAFSELESLLFVLSVLAQRPQEHSAVPLNL